MRRDPLLLHSVQACAGHTPYTEVGRRSLTSKVSMVRHELQRTLDTTWMVGVMMAAFYLRPDLNRLLLRCSRQKQKP